MRRIGLMIGVCLGLMLGVTAALAQTGTADFAARTSLTKFEPMIVAAQPLKTFEGVLGSSFTAGFYAALGSTVEGGRPLGAFSALINTPDDLLFKGSTLSIGPEWRVERDKNDSSKYSTSWDAVVQLVVRSSKVSSFSMSVPSRRGFGLMFSRRF